MLYSCWHLSIQWSIVEEPEEFAFEWDDLCQFLLVHSCYTAVSSTKKKKKKVTSSDLLSLFAQQLYLQLITKYTQSLINQGFMNFANSHSELSNKLFFLLHSSINYFFFTCLGLAHIARQTYTCIQRFPVFHIGCMSSHRRQLGYQEQHTKCLLSMHITDGI